MVCIYWVMDSVDCFGVGFLPKYMTIHADCHHCILAQATEVFDESHPSPFICKKMYHHHGYCKATILDPQGIM